MASTASKQQPNSPNAPQPSIYNKAATINAENDKLERKIQDLRVTIQELHQLQVKKQNTLKETNAKQQKMKIKIEQLTERLNELQSQQRDINLKIYNSKTNTERCPSMHILQLHNASNIDQCTICRIRPGSGTKIKRCPICNYIKCVECGYNRLETKNVEPNTTKKHKANAKAQRSKKHKANAKASKPKQSARGWKELKSVPFTNFSNAVQINNNDLILAGEKGIFKYNGKKWKLFIKYPISYRSPHNYAVTLAIDRNTDSLYMFTKTHNGYKIMELNLRPKVRGNKQWSTTSQTRSAGANPISCMVGDRVHLFGGTESNFHLMWNPLVKALKIVDGSGKINKLNSASGAVYVEKNNRLLLFGGKSETRVIWQLILDEHKWMECGKLLTNISSCACIITNDQKYVVIFSAESRDILILDVDTMQSRRSTIQMPFGVSGKKRKLNAMLMDKTAKYKTLLEGFVRKHFDKNIGQQVIELLLLWCVSNDIHLFKAGGAHWKIDVETVLGLFEDDTTGLTL